MKGIFRNARTDEADAVLSLYRSVTDEPFCVWNDVYPGMEEILGDLKADCLFVLSDEHRLMGAISVVPSPELDAFPFWRCQGDTYREIARVVVDRAYRGSGLAYEMVQRIASLLSRRGCTSLRLAVAKVNLPAYKTYIRAGFETVGEAELYGGHYYLMEKALDSVPLCSNARGMQICYTCRTPSPLGELLLSSDGEALTGLWFAGQRHFGAGLQDCVQVTDGDLPLFSQTKEWLSLYFSGVAPDVLPPLRMIGTAFQREVWQLLCRIPYGHTVSYGTLARRLADSRGGKPVSAQAVGGAVGHNRISILIPCHRVVGADGDLRGYAGGLERKRFLLTLEARSSAERKQIK